MQQRLSLAAIMISNSLKNDLPLIFRPNQPLKIPIGVNSKSSNILMFYSWNSLYIYKNRTKINAKITSDKTREKTKKPFFDSIFGRVYTDLPDFFVFQDKAIIVSADI